MTDPLVNELADVAEAHFLPTINELVRVLKAYEQWEADIILESKCWTGSNVQLTEELYERMIELQTMRNRALAAMGGAKL